MKSKAPKRAKILTSHPQMRALQRYGIRITKEEQGIARLAIVNGEIALVKKLANGAEIYEVVIQGVKLYAVFKPSKKKIVTFLTRCMFDRKYKKPRRNKFRQTGRASNRRSRKKEPEEFWEEY